MPRPPQGQSPAPTIFQRLSPPRWRYKAAPRSRRRPSPRNREAPTAGSECPSLSSSFSRLRDRIFVEDLPDPLERLLRGCLRRHAIFDIDPPGAPNVLVLHLGIGRVVGPELRQGGTQQALSCVSRPMRVVEPPVIALHGGRHTRNVAAEARLQPLV